MSIYTATKIKTFEGMEGRGYNATLLRDGKPVAEVIDDASGGGTMFHWLDRDAKAVVRTVNHKDEPHEYNGTVEEAMFVAYCLTLPKWTYSGMTSFQSTDMVVDGLVNAVETERRLKRQFKTKLVFVDGGQEYSYGSKTKGVDPLTLVDGLKRKRPTAVILNLLPLEEAVRMSLAQGE
jgi:hypothetical protein